MPDPFSCGDFGALDDGVRDQLKSLVLRYGSHELSYSALQRGLRYFVVPDVGFVAYDVQGASGRVLALSDPTAHPKDHARVAELFLERHGDAMWCQVHREFAKLLHRRFGYFVNQAGVVTELPLGSWDLSGPRKQVIRTAVKKVAESGVEIEEVDGRSVDPAAVERLSGEWLSGKTVKDQEMRFLVRPLELQNDWGTRNFRAVQEGEVVGLGVFSPLYRDGSVIGYCSDIMRVSSRAPKGLAHAINAAAYRRFEEENRENRELRARLGKKETRHIEIIEKLSLGLSPYAHIHDDEHMNSALTTVLLTALYQFGNSLYNAKGLAEYKRAYDASEVPVYIASRHRLPILQLLGLYRACNVGLRGRRPAGRAVAA